MLEFDELNQAKEFIGQKWEYRWIRVYHGGRPYVDQENGQGLDKQPRLDVYLKRLGSQGWEMVGLDSPLFISSDHWRSNSWD